MKAKIKVLARRIRRSIRTDRDKWIKGTILAVVLLVIVIFAGSCACGKKTAKKPDEASQGVMKISPAPTPVPTEAPRQVNRNAAAVSGNVTMINEYLVQKEAQGASRGTENRPAAGEDTDSTEEE